MEEINKFWEYLKAEKYYAGKDSEEVVASLYNDYFCADVEIVLDNTGRWHIENISLDRLSLDGLHSLYFEVVKLKEKIDYYNNKNLKD